MAMSTGPSGGGAGSSPMVDINTTPLVDVMLVLLIIFMITAPLLAHKVRINLPQQSTDPADKSKIEQKRLELRDLGGAVEIRLNNEPISQDMLFTEFRDPHFRPAPLLEHLVKGGYLGRKTGHGFRSYAKK